VLAVRASEKNAGLRAWRPDNDPPLRPSIIRQRRRVLDEVESQRSREECDCLVVVIDDDRELLDPHAPRLVRLASGRAGDAGPTRALPAERCSMRFYLT
jgi:hypothetical protein